MWHCYSLQDPGPCTHNSSQQQDVRMVRTSAVEWDSQNASAAFWSSAEGAGILPERDTLWLDLE